VKKGENLVTHEKEIMSRPKRTWFESEKDKTRAKEAGWRELNADITAHDNTAKKAKKKLSNKEKKRLDLRDQRKDARAWKKGKNDADSVKAAKKQKHKAKGKEPNGTGGKATKSKRRS
jgi:ATP-dependent RNA helicase DDX27